jgi:ribosomal-protein-alanine N-acetyltransferase
MMPIKIPTGRLLLRDFEPFDLMEIQKYASDEEVAKYMEWGPNSLEDTSRFFAELLKNGRRMPRLHYDFAMVEKESNKFIGTISLRIQSQAHKQADIGYVMNRQFWNKGLMSEAASAVLEYGFKNLDLHRIYALSRVENVASIKLLKKIGMKSEGILREHLFYKNKWWSSEVFSKLKTE